MATLNISLTVVDQTTADRLLNDFCTHYNYDPNGGRTKAQFIKDWLIIQIRDACKREEQAAAISTVVANKDTEINSISIT